MKGMAVLVVAVLALASSAVGTSSEGALSATFLARERALETSWEKELQPPKQVAYKSPVQRVIALLKKMKAELEAEHAKEAELYDKMVCWCETNEKEKTKAIADADAKITELVAEIEMKSALTAKLQVMIDQTKVDLKEMEMAKEKSLAIREGEAEEFYGRQKELTQAISQLKNAIIVLSKGGAEALLQSNSPMVTALRTVLRSVAVQYDVLQGDSPSAGGPSILSQRLQTALVSVRSQTHRASQEEMAGQKVMRMILSALDARGASEDSELPIKFADEYLATEAARLETKQGTAFVQQPSANAGSYVPRSGVIMGILKQMKEDFETELADVQKEEGQGVENYKEYMAELEKNIELAKKKLDEYQAEFFANKKLLIDAKELLDLTRDQRAKDVEFLKNLKLICNDLDNQWALRSKARSDEIVAVNEALAVLTDDDNRELLAKSVTLLQEESTTSARARMTAAAALRRAAQNPALNFDDLLAAWQGRSARRPAASAGRPREQLSTLAVSVELDSFTKVKAAMDKMVADLKAEQEEEVKFKLFCDAEFDANEKMTYKKTEEKEDLEAKIESLAALIKKLTEEIAAATERIAEAKKEQLAASTDREAENAEYQQVIADQRATQVILKKALDKLAAVYKTQKRGNSAFLEKQTPPVQFTPYKQNAGSSPVMGLIEQIIEDSKKTEAEEVKGEAAAQAGYETFIKDANEEIATLTTLINEKTKAIEGAKLDTETAKGDLAATEAELQSLADYLADLHGQCDFIVKNFDIRQKARLNEIEAIQQAKAILSGMK